MDMRTKAQELVRLRQEYYDGLATSGEYRDILFHNAPAIAQTLLDALDLLKYIASEREAPKFEGANEKMFREASAFFVVQHAARDFLGKVSE